MNPITTPRRVLAALASLALLAGVPSARAESLVFIAQLMPDGSVNYDWFSAGNWFHMTPDGLAHVGRVPGPDESARVQTDVNAAGNAIHVASLTTGPGTKVHGGNFDVPLVSMEHDSTFEGSTLRVTTGFGTDGLAYLDATHLVVEGGATATISFLAPRTGGSLGLSGGTTVDVQGTLILTASTGIGALGPCTLVVEPGADVRAQGTASIMTTAAPFVLDNRGSVQAFGSTLTLSGLTYASASKLGFFRTRSPDAVIKFADRPVVVPAGVEFDVTGPGRTRFLTSLRVDGTLSVGARDAVTRKVDPGYVELAPVTGDDGPGQVMVLADADAAGTLEWKSGHLGVSNLTIDAGAQLLVSGNGGNGTSTLDTGVLINRGRVTLAGTSGLALGAGTSVANLAGATLEILTDAGISGSGNPAPLIDNAGTFVKSGGTFVSQVGCRVANSGTFSVASGGMNFQRGFSQSAGSTTVPAGTTLAVGSPGLEIAGGRLGGAGTLTGAVLNSGVVAPGSSPGRLTLASGSSYTQTAKGTLEIEVGGLGVGTDSDFMTVAGNVSLAGTVNVKLVNGFVPQPGSSVLFLGATSLGGALAPGTGFDLGNGTRAELFYLAPGAGVPPAVGIRFRAVTPVTLHLATSAPVRPELGSTLSFASAPGQAYTAEWSADLRTWHFLVSGTAIDATMNFADPTPVNSVPARFYRVRAEP